PASGDLRLNGALVRVDAATGKAVSIERIEIPFARPSTPGQARLITGKEPAAAALAAAKARVDQLRAAGIVPTLALVSAGEDPASQIFLARKSEACAKVGAQVRRVQIAAGADTAAVIERVRALGNDREVHGLLVQLPLAAPAESGPVLDAIPPDKDVD